MLYFPVRSLVFWTFPCLIFLSGCAAKSECDSFETRNAVLLIVSDDHNNALANFAAKNSTVVKEKSSTATSEAEKSANFESTKPLYLLGEKIVTTSTSKDKSTLKCSGSMSVTVGDTKASKEVNFTVQQSSEGKISVSVTPFQF
jgi:predicted metal-dependent hydrolase